MHANQADIRQTWINMMCVDPIGRRKVLVWTVWGMAGGLLAVAIAFSYIPIDTETLAITTDTVSTPAIIVLVFIIWFVVFVSVPNPSNSLGAEANCEYAVRCIRRQHRLDVYRLLSHRGSRDGHNVADLFLLVSIAMHSGKNTSDAG